MYSMMHLGVFTSLQLQHATSINLNKTYAHQKSQIQLAVQCQAAMNDAYAAHSWLFLH